MDIGIKKFEDLIPHKVGKLHPLKQFKKIYCHHLLQLSGSGSFTSSSLLLIAGKESMLGGSLVTTTWHIFRLQKEMGSRYGG
jgi:hypothetical protein